MKDSLPVVEIFGPTIQGEGALIGAQTMFLRLGGCDYRCLSGETRILLSDFTHKKLKELSGNDEILGWRNGKILPSKLLSKSKPSLKESFLVSFEDGSQIISTGDHPFFKIVLKGRGVWYGDNMGSGYKELKDLRVGDLIRGFGHRALSPCKTLEWYKGYLSGAMDGDGHIGEGWIGLGATDLLFIEAVQEASAKLKVPLHRLSDTETTRGSKLYKLRLSEKYREAFTKVVLNFVGSSYEFCRGYLAGMFDAEGHIPEAQPYITQVGTKNHSKIVKSYECLRLNSVIYKSTGGASRYQQTTLHPVSYLALIDIQGEKRSKLLGRGMNRQYIKIVDISAVGQQEVYDISTSTENFFAEGMLVHNCSWCDSLHAVLPEEVAKNSVYMSPSEIRDTLQGLETITTQTPWVTISGGNPAIHKSLGPLVHLLQASGYRIALETQGSVWHDWIEDCDLVTVSPKPPSSAMKTDFHKLSFFSRRLFGSEKMNLKVVVFDREDLEYAKDIAKRYPEFPLYLSVGNDVGKNNTTDLLEKLEWLVNECKGVDRLKTAIILPQLHVLLWGNRKGV